MTMEIITKEAVESIKEIMTPVAQKIGETAEWGWGVVVKQMYVEATLATVYIVIGLIALGVGVSIVKWMYSKAKESEYDGEGWIAGCFVISAIVCLSTIPFILANIHTAVTHFINPEFYAIQFFIGLVK